MGEIVTEHDAERGAEHNRLRLSGALLATLYLALCAGVLVLAANRRTAPLADWEQVGAGLGLVALVAMALQIATTGRIRSVSGRLGVDRIMAFHKLAAWWIVLALLLHPLFYVLPTWRVDGWLGAERFIAYLTLPHYRSGVVALAALLLLVFTSVLRGRLPWRYEIWRAGHLFLGLSALGGGLHHALTTGRFSAAGPVQSFWWGVGLGVLSLLAVLYGWRWLMLRRRAWRLERVTKRADRMWELDLRPNPGSPPFEYRAGQFVWMTVGRRRLPLFDHPFSIAGTPLRPGLKLVIKEVGDFTRTVGSLQPGTPIGIDGPYGEFTLETHGGDAVLLLAGGVGIAPIMGLLRDMKARRDPRPVRLAYAAGRPANFAFIDEVEASKGILALETMFVSEQNEPGWRGALGMLDSSRLASLLDGLPRERTVAFICGPGPMVSAVSDALLDLGLTKENVVYERFDYGGGAGSRLDRRRTGASIVIGAALAAAVLFFAAAI